MPESYTLDELLTDDSEPHASPVYSFDDLTRDQSAESKPNFQEFSELGPTQEDTEYLKEPLGGRTEIPAGTGPITIPLSAMGRLAGGIVDYATTPQGVAEMGLSLTPAAPLVAAKWTKDMATSAIESAQSLHERFSSLVGNRIGQAMMRTQNMPIPDSVKQAEMENLQGAADDALNILAGGLGSITAAKHALKTAPGMIPESVKEAAKGIVPDAVEGVNNLGRNYRAVQEAAMEQAKQTEPKEANAIQEQSANAEVLRQPQSELELQGVGARNAQPEVPAGTQEAVPSEVVPPKTGQAGVLPIDQLEAIYDKAVKQGDNKTAQQILDTLENHFGLKPKIEVRKVVHYGEPKWSVFVDNVERTADHPDLPASDIDVANRAAREAESDYGFRPGQKDASGRVLPLKELFAEELSSQPSPKLPQIPTGPSKGIAASVRNKWTTATEPTFGSEAGFINLDPLKEIWEKYSPKVKDAIGALSDIVKDEMTLPKTNDYRRSVLNWSGKMQRSFGEAAEAQKDMQKAIPDPIRRDGVTNWIQAGGDPVVLQDRLAKTLAWRDPATGKPHPQAGRLAAGYEAALNLTPEEIAAANDAKNAFDTLHTRGTGYGVLNSFKDNYVTQIWDLKRGPTGGAGSRTLKDRFRFSRASSFPTYFDGEQAGFVPKTKDISKILPVYLHEMNSVIAARQLVEQMSKGKASDGRPLLAAKGIGVPVTGTSGSATLVLPDVSKPDFSDYKTLSNQPALHDWRWQTKDAAGNPVFMKADLALHPEAYGRLKNALGKSAITEWYQSEGSRTQAIPKALVKAVDIGQAEAKRTMLGAGAPFHQVQEGTHAVGHRINPFTNIPTIDLVNNRAQMDAANHGLMLMPDRASAEQFMEGFRQSGLVSKIPKLGPLADHYSNYLFHEYIPGIKFKTYEAILRRNLDVYAKDLASGKATVEDVKALSASQVNAAYGHLNYADINRNPTIQHLLRLGLLAPDFLEARARFAGQAIKGIGGGKIGREQVIALATLAVAQATLSYAVAKATGGQWDYKDPFAFHVGNRKFTLRSVPEDLMRFANDTRAFVYARLNPTLMKGAVQLVSGTDWRGNKVGAGQTIKEIAQQPIPLVLRPLFGIGNSPLSGWEQLAGAVGLKISRYSAQSEIKKAAHQWMANSKDPKLQAEEARFQKESFGDSDYKPLREALINNDFKTAKAEYQKLLTTKNPELIARTMNHPRPFSGNVSREAAFQRSLSEDQKVLYNQAVKEREELRQKFNKMLYGR